MKIIVTGGLGFIGSAVIRLALQKGHYIINVDALTYASCKENLASVKNNKNYIFEHVDVCNRNDLDDLFLKHSPDAVMHLAAESHVDRSIESPTSFINTNIVGTFNILEASLNYWQKAGEPKGFRFHHISTDEVYGSLGNDLKEKFTEETPYDPRSPYSASKASSDHLVRAWYETYQLPILLTNCSNNYGPYHFPEKLIPVVILNALHEKSIPVYGDGLNIRDWLYVEDHADALLLVLEKGEVGRSYNIGGDNEITNIELVQSICTILDEVQPRDSGSYKDLITFVSDRPGHDKRYAIDATRIKNELGWIPSVTLNQGLKKTINWYIKNENWWKPLLSRVALGMRIGLNK